MGMFCTSVHFQFFNHGVTQGTFRQHAFYGLFQSAAGELLLHFAEGTLVYAARETGMAEVFFVFKFGTGYTQFVRVDDDDVIAGIDVGVYSGLCLPRRRLATSAATRPKTLSWASMTNHSRFTSWGFAEKVFIVEIQIDIESCKF